MNKKGMVLPLVITLGLILSLTGVAFIHLARTEREFSQREVYPSSSFWISEAGTEHAEAWLKDDLETTGAPYPGTEPFQPFPKQEFGAGEYEVTIDPDDDNPGKSIKKYKIISLARIETNLPSGELVSRKEVDVVIRIESFAKFAYFTNNEYNPEVGQKIWFMGKDSIYGPLHSNSRINICGDPTFYGKVTSSADSFNYYHGGPPADNPDFREGYELGVEAIDMNKYKNLDRLKTAAKSGGLYLSGNYKITLNQNGTLTYKKGHSSHTVNISSFNGVVYCKGNVSIKGTLKGRLTVAVASSKYISIIGHLKYKTPPDNPDCTDILGLVAGKKIKVSRYAPNNLRIDATLMVFNKSFYVENFRSRRPSGKLTIWGGIIQNYRGPVGTFWAHSGQIASGFSKDYHYDSRVLENPPPYFPTTGRYELALWQEVQPD